MGESSGSHLVFNNNGHFELLITANLGFGRETLDSESLNLDNGLAGAILNCQIDPEINLEEQPEVLTYFVDTKYFDPNLEVSSAFLEYAYVIDEHYPEPQKYDPNELYYESLPIENPISTIVLEGISNYNVRMHLRLVVYLNSQEIPTILDEYEFSTPFRFMGSVYDQDVGANYAVFSVYLSGTNEVEMSLWLDL